MLPYFVIGGVVILVIWLGWRFYKYHKKKQDTTEQPNNSKLTPDEQRFFDDYYRGMNG